MQEGQQRAVALPFDPQVVQAALARGQPVGAPIGLGTGGQGGHHGQAALAEEVGVALLVQGVEQEQAAQERVLRLLGGADQVAAPVGLDLGEAQQVIGAPPGVAPDPSVDR